jgi:hypothetical protein
MRERHQAIVDGLSSIEAAAKANGGGPYAVLRFGLGTHRWVVEWCREQEAEIDRGTE